MKTTLTNIETIFFIENETAVHLVRDKNGIGFTVHKNNVEITKGILYTQNWNRAQKLAAQILKNM